MYVCMYVRTYVRTSGAVSETRYTSVERDDEREARDEKNPPVVSPLCRSLPR